MKVLITGATGFLGSHLTRRMVAEGHQVRILCRPTSSLSRLAGLDFEKRIGDVTDATTFPAAIEGCDAVIHAAANLDYWKGDEAWQTKVNVEGTRNVARVARECGVKRFLHVSSVAAVGIPCSPDKPANEDFAFNLQRSRLTYHLSKRQGEAEVFAEVARGLNAVIVNPASIQGPQRTAALIASVRRSPIVPCYSGGNCIVDIEDVVEGILVALDRGRAGERYILGGENLTFRALGEKAARTMNLHRRYVMVPPIVTGLGAAILESMGRLRNRPPKITRMIHYCANRFQYFDSSKASRELGYTPRNVDAILAQYLRSESKAADAVSGEKDPLRNSIGRIN